MENNYEVIYEGFFLPTLRKYTTNYSIANSMKKTLENKVANLHVTTKFKPETSSQNFYGYHAVVRLVGYGNDSNNEGYLVELDDCDDEFIRETFNSIKCPHITTSYSAESKPVNTSNLTFDPMPEDEHLDLILVFGAFVKDKNDGKTKFVFQ